MIELMRLMLSHIDNKDIKKDKDFQLLKGLYKIPNSVKEARIQYNIK